MYNIETRRRPFLELLLLNAKQGAQMSDADIINQVDTFMFEVKS